MAIFKNERTKFVCFDTVPYGTVLRVVNDNLVSIRYQQEYHNSHTHSGIPKLP